MKTLLRSWQRVAASVAFIAFVALLTGAQAFAGQGPYYVRVVPLNELVYGMTYGEWTAAWWQYVLSMPADQTHPILDTSGAHCGNNQPPAPVFFLVGTATTDPVERHCTVPAGKTLVIPLINVECSTLEPGVFLGKNGHELRACASKFVNGVSLRSLKFEVDGVAIPYLRGYRVQSPVFDILDLPYPNYLQVGAGGIGFSVSDGYWVILNLSPGKHTIHFEAAWAADPGNYDAAIQNVTYHLKIRK